MGQEFNAPSPFLFSADHGPELAAQAREQRAEFLAQFASVSTAAARRTLADPASVETFERSGLDWSARERNAPVLRLHRDLLALRRTDPAIRQRRADLMHGAVLAERAVRAALLLRSR